MIRKSISFKPNIMATIQKDQDLQKELEKLTEYRDGLVRLEALSATPVSQVTLLIAREIGDKVDDDALINYRLPNVYRDKRLSDFIPGRKWWCC